MMTKRRGIAGLILALLLTLSMATGAAAAQAVKASITLDNAQPGMEFQLYQVGTNDNTGEFILSLPFNGYSVDLTSKDAAATLADYIRRDNIEPMQTAKAEEKETVTFTGLDQGVFLILGCAVTVGNTRFTPSPVMLSLPQWEDLNPVWNVTVSCKCEMGPKVRQIAVAKVWKGDTKDTRPEEIEVQLLKKGAKEPFDTQKLNAKNNWAYLWKDLDANEEWSVLEKTVPDGYQVAVEQKKPTEDTKKTENTHETEEAENTESTEKTEGTTKAENTKDRATYVIYNTKGGNTPPGGGGSNGSGKGSGKLPQTGQLWWPVSVLACGGLTFLLIGLIRRRQCDEET